MVTFKNLMLNAGVTLCLLMAYHTVINAPALNTLGHFFYTETEQRRDEDKRIRQLYNTMAETQNKINEDIFNQQKELKEAIRNWEAGN